MSCSSGGRPQSSFYVQLPCLLDQGDNSEGPGGAYREACESIREANQDQKGFEIQEPAEGCEMGSPLGPPFFSDYLSLPGERLMIDITEKQKLCKRRYVNQYNTVIECENDHDDRISSY